MMVASRNRSTLLSHSTLLISLRGGSFRCLFTFVMHLFPRHPLIDGSDKPFDLCRYTNYLLQGGQGNKDKRDNESNKVTKNIVRLLL